MRKSFTILQKNYVRSFLTIQLKERNTSDLSDLSEERREVSYDMSEQELR
jgi:hypothetical protein